MSWASLAIPTTDRIERALAEGRTDDARAFARMMVTDAQEIHDLYTEWSRRIPELIAEEPSDPAVFAAEWDAFVLAAHDFDGDLDALIDRWRGAHDRHVAHVADLVDRAVAAWGEDRLGELWRELQRDGISFYRATYGPDQPWAASAERLLCVAIEGMHGHLGGPAGRGEITVSECDDRVSLSFHPCGSGGRVLAGGENGVVEGRHDFAWNEPGVCRYCVHCCVLQQLGPIDDFGYPARVVDPPLNPGDHCTWTVYRDPSLVPSAAYERVGRRKPDG